MGDKILIILIFLSFLAHREVFSSTDTVAGRPTAEVIKLPVSGGTDILQPMEDSVEANGGTDGSTMISSQGISKNIKISATVDKPTATTGDKIKYTVTITYKPGVKVEIPEFGSEIGGFRITDMGEEKPENREDMVEVAKWYILQADMVGPYIIPPAKVAFTDLDKKQKEVFTSKIFLTVKSVIGDKDKAQDIKEIKPNLVLPYKMPWLYIFMGVAFFILIGVLIFLVLKRKKKPVLTKISPFLFGMGELQKLAKMGLLEKGEIKSHFFILSEIFRKYIELRFNFPAAESTTEEILPEVFKIGELEKSFHQRIEEFLVSTDLIKFANIIPDTEKIGELNKFPTEFINFTKPSVEVVKQ